jgi:hypothetical protein
LLLLVVVMVMMVSEIQYSDVLKVHRLSISILLIWRWRQYVPSKRPKMFRLVQVSDQPSWFQWYRFWLVYERCPFRTSTRISTILTEVPRGFHQILQINTCIIPLIMPYCFLPHNFHFIIPISNW